MRSAARPAGPESREPSDGSPGARFTTSHHVHRLAAARLRALVLPLLDAQLDLALVDRRLVRIGKRRVVRAPALAVEAPHEAREVMAVEDEQQLTRVAMQMAVHE